MQRTFNQIKVRATSSSYPLCQILFLSRPPLLSNVVITWRKTANSLNHSINHSPSLFNAPGTKACTLYAVHTHIMHNSQYAPSRIVYGTLHVNINLAEFHLLLPPFKCGTTASQNFFGVRARQLELTAASQKTDSSAIKLSMQWN